MSRDISPPPAKRHKTVPEPPAPATHKTLTEPEPLVPLSQGSMRIFSWNINGITPFLQNPITSFFQPSKLQSTAPAPHAASLRGFLQRHQWPAILFLQEVKITSKDTKTQEAVRTAINSKLPSEEGSDRDRPRYEAYFTLPNDPHNARGLGGSGKIYGVCSIIRSDLCQKYNVSVRTVDWDWEGRISTVKINSVSSRLAIFNIYAVNGTDNPYRDKITGSVRGTRHDRKLEVHRLLRQECKAFEAKGWDILLAGDMNVAPDARDGHPKLRTFPHQHVINRANFHEQLLGDGKGEGLDGVDVWRQMHEEEKRYTWFSRTKPWGTSCDRVDYFVAGRRAWNTGLIKACGIMDSKAERGPSDHVPIWVDIELKSDEHPLEEVRLRE